MRKMSSQPFPKYKVVLALLNITKGWERYLRIFIFGGSSHVLLNAYQAFSTRDSTWRSADGASKCHFSSLSEYSKENEESSILSNSQIRADFGAQQNTLSGGPRWGCIPIDPLPSSTNSLKSGQFGRGGNQCNAGSRFPSNGPSSNTYSICLCVQIWFEK